MRRRRCLRVLGTIVGGVFAAGCSSNASEDGSGATTPTRQPAGSATSVRSTGRDTGESTTTPTSGESATAGITNGPTGTASGNESTTGRIDDEPTTRRTAGGSTTADTTVEPTTAEPTTLPTPDPPANRLLAATALGEGWRYVDGSAPQVRTNGTITATYRGTQPYTRTLRTRLWRCEGETLDALGGTCSLGNLPDRYRAREGVETASPTVGDTAFAWWSGPRTDIEVVAADHVFRMTHTPRQADGPTGSLPSRESRLNALVEIARRQTEKLARLG
jgi:hypothetical protein